MVAESQIFADSVMGIVDLLAATAGLQIDFNADIVNGYSQKAQANDLRIEGILLVEIEAVKYSVSMGMKPSR